MFSGSSVTVCRLRGWMDNTRHNKPAVGIGMSSTFQCRQLVVMIVLHKTWICSRLPRVGCASLMASIVFRISNHSFKRRAIPCLVGIISCCPYKRRIFWSPHMGNHCSGNWNISSTTNVTLIFDDFVVDAHGFDVDINLFEPLSKWCPPKATTWRLERV